MRKEHGTENPRGWVLTPINGIAAFFSESYFLIHDEKLISKVCSECKGLQP